MPLKTIQGAAERRIPAPAGVCLRTAEDVEQWPEWLSTIHSVAVTDGTYVQARILGIPLIFETEIERDPSKLLVRRKPFGPDDPERFELDLGCIDDGDGCHASARISASLDLPRLLPVPGAIADQVAGRLLSDLEKRALSP
jgi:hypothetical protein